MKPTLRTVLLIIAAVVVAVLALVVTRTRRAGDKPGRNVPVSEVGGEWQLHTSRGLSIEYPPAWKVQETNFSAEQTAGSATQLLYQAELITADQDIDSVLVTESRMPLDQLTQWWVNYYQPDHTSVKAVPTKVGERQATRIEVTDTDRSGQKFSFRTYLIADGQRTIGFEPVYAPLDDPFGQGLTERMFKSLQIYSTP